MRGSSSRLAATVIIAAHNSETCWPGGSRGDFKAGVSHGVSRLWSIERLFSRERRQQRRFLLRDPQVSSRGLVRCSWRQLKLHSGRNFWTRNKRRNGYMLSKLHRTNGFCDIWCHCFAILELPGSQAWRHFLLISYAILEKRMTYFHNFTRCKGTKFAISSLQFSICAFQYTRLIDVVSKRFEWYLKITYGTSVWI